MALPKPKTRAGFFELERATWNKLTALTKGLPRAAWTEPNTLGAWSLKDVSAHLADWMIETHDRIPKILRAEKLPRLSITEFNRAHHKSNQKLTTAQARQRLTHERQALLQFLKTLSEDDLLGHKDVYTWASWATFNHYDNHIPSIARFRRAILRRAK
ncbi:MAG: DinB family protein [Anaerolineales bacterium]|nr:DinB family protein [Anaerolineales bacterium]